MELQRKLEILADAAKYDASCASSGAARKDSRGGGGVGSTGGALDDLWRTYFRSSFNPARLNPKAMQAEMPKKYWRNLPEAELIPGLIAGSTRRVAGMREADARPATQARDE